MEAAWRCILIQIEILVSKIGYICIYHAHAKVIYIQEGGGISQHNRRDSN